MNLNVVSTFKNGFLVKIDRNDTFINTLDPIITQNCNLLCSHCWGCNSGDTNMDYSIYCKILKLAKYLKIQNIQFTGGEPLLNPDFLNFATISQNNGFINKLRTNFAIKVLEDDVIINILKNFSSIYISLDGDYKINFSLRPSKEYIFCRSEAKEHSCSVRYRDQHYKKKETQCHRSEGTKHHKNIFLINKNIIFYLKLTNKNLL